MDFRRKAAYRRIPRRLRRNTRARAWHPLGGRRVPTPVKTLLGLTTLTVTCLILWMHPGFEPLPFSRVDWAVASVDQRGYMVDDFLAKNAVRGMPQEQLVALLGKPDQMVLVEEKVQAHSDGATSQELLPWYGADARGRLHSADYKIGSRAFRAGLRFLPEYWLHVKLRDGKVEQAWIGD